MPEAIRVVVTCEHATNRVPSAYRHLFKSKSAQAALASHRGWDPGSLEMGRFLSRAIGAPLFAAPASRLLVEVNRSPHHRSLFSEFSRPLGDAERARVIEKYYDPHRMRVAIAIRKMLKGRHRVIHLGMHTFTPMMKGIVRNADIGLLYDPKRSGELAFCTAWKRSLLDRAPSFRVRRNYPYLGRADGFTTFLRRELKTSRYLGIELEVSQRFTAISHRIEWRRLLAALRDCLRLAIHQM